MGYLGQLQGKIACFWFSFQKNVAKLQGKFGVEHWFGSNQILFAMKEGMGKHSLSIKSLEFLEMTLMHGSEERPRLEAQTLGEPRVLWHQPLPALGVLAIKYCRIAFQPKQRGVYFQFFFFFTVFLWRLLDCSIPRALICSATSSEGCSTQQKLSFPDSDTSKIKLRVTPNPVLFSPPGLAKERYSEEKYYPKQDSEMHMRHLEGATKRHCPHSLCFLMEYSKLLFLKAWDV